TPVIEGEVTRISADALKDERSGEPYYLVRVKVSDEGMKKLGDRKLQPGMPAEVLINALVKANKQFQFMAYPNRTHNISEGPGTSQHLRTLYTTYLKQHCLPGAR
ncbi:MAG: hypothetical protein EOP54_29040, partial [Sphingobacteriales bacterium]